jgi:hypothetical protein
VKTSNIFFILADLAIPFPFGRFISILYIPKSTKNQKANPAKRICPIENCRYSIRAKMSDISQVFEEDDISTFW